MVESALPLAFNLLRLPNKDGYRLGTDASKKPDNWPVELEREDRAQRRVTKPSAFTKRMRLLLIFCKQSSFIPT